MGESLGVGTDWGKTEGELVGEADLVKRLMRRIKERERSISTEQHVAKGHTALHSGNVPAGASTFLGQLNGCTTLAALTGQTNATYHQRLKRTEMDIPFTSDGQEWSGRGHPRTCPITGISARFPCKFVIALEGWMWSSDLCSLPYVVLFYVHWKAKSCNFLHGMYRAM
jgi:hypothetical protein